MADPDGQAVEVFYKFFNFRFVGLDGRIDECAHWSLFFIFDGLNRGGYETDTCRTL